MQTFINNIYSFINQLSIMIGTSINNISGTNTFNLYKDFLDKQIIGGTLINIGLTWKELFLYTSTWALTIFFIIFVFHIVYKVIGLICLK